MSRTNTAPRARAGPSSATRPSPPARGQFDPACQVYLNGLTMQTMGRDVVELFKPYGPIVDMALSASRDGQGTGTITFSSPAMAARAAKECEWSTIQGRGINVQRVAHDPEPAPTSGQGADEEARPPLRDHHEFARLLKITDEPGGHNNTPLRRREQKELWAFSDAALIGRSIEELRPFWARVAASYLPQLIQTHINYPWSFSSTSSESDGLAVFGPEWSRWMTALTQSVLFNRFVREHPDDALALERVMLDKITRVPMEELDDAVTCEVEDPDFDYSEQEEPIIVALSESLLLWNALFHAIRTYLPEGHPIAQPSKQTRRRLKELYAILIDLQHCRRSRPGRSCKAVNDFFSMEYEERTLTENDRDFGRWWMCEAGLSRNGDSKRDAETDGELAQDCKELPDHDLPACSRCGAVRYCSEAHQRADWPRHRLVCIRPRW